MQLRARARKAAGAAEFGKQFIFCFQGNQSAQLNVLDLIGAPKQRDDPRAPVDPSEVSLMVERDSLEAQMRSAGSGESPGRKADEDDFPEVHLSEAVQETIGRSLKAYYDDIAKEPIPDRFLVLLAQLEAQELKGGGRGK
jgi:hypothetical protein